MKKTNQFHRKKRWMTLLSCLGMSIFLYAYSDLRIADSNKNLAEDGSLVYCTPVATETAYFIKDFTTTGGSVNISNTNSGIGTGGYSNNTTTSVRQTAGGTVNFTAAYSTGTYGLAIWVDWNGNTTFEASERVYNTTEYGSSASGNFVVPVATTNGSYRMRVLADYNKNNPENPCTFNSGNGEAEDYTLEVADPPTCIAPTDLGVGNVTFTTAQFSWLAEGTVFDVEYGPAGFAHGSGTMATSVSNPYNVTGLTPDTSYQFYVRRNCGGGDLSTWAGPFRFYTGYCLPVAGSTGYYIKDFSTTGGFTNITNTNTNIGTGGYSNYANMKVSQSESGTVNFSAAYSGGSGFAIWVDWNKNMAFDTDERVFGTTAYGAAATGSFTVPAGTPVGNYRMRIRMDYNNSSPSDACTFASGNGEAEDYTLEVSVTPTCLPPTELGVGNVTLTTAQFSWLGEGTVFDVEYGPAGFTQGTGTMASSVANPYDATGLTATTAYQFYVRRNCGAGDKSPWAGPFRFFTGYCTPAATGTTSFIKDFTTTGGYTNITNTNTGIGTGGYSNHTAMKVSKNEGSSVSFSAVYNSGTFGCAIWIDWNNNLTFEASERVFNTTEYGSSSAGSFTVPAGTPIGNYRMRVLADYNKSDPDNPCGFSSGNGEAEDYTFEVVTPPTCMAPTDLGVGNVTFTTAQFSWLGEGTVFDVEYGVAGFTQGTGTMASSVANPYNATALTADTFYQFYVRRDCGAGDKSAWAGPYRFYTGYCLPAATSTSYFIKDFATTGGFANITNTNTNIGTGGYSNYAAMKVSQIENGVINFNAAYSSGSGFAIWVDWNKNMSFDTDERVFNTTAYGAAATGSFTIPAGTAVGNYRMRIRMDYNNSSPSDACTFSSGNGEAEDYTLEVATPPSCLPPTALGIGTMTPTTAQLTWTSNGTLFDIEYGTTGFTQGSGTMATSTTSSLTIATLTAETAYQFYVRRDCGAGDKSSWAGPFSFFTGYCTPAATSTSNFIKDFTTTGGFTNITNTNTGIGTGGYSNHTAMRVSQNEGGSVSFSAVYNSGTFGCAIWIDWNKNLTFEASERVFNTTEFATSSSGTFTVPAGTPVGNYRMRVLADYNKDNPENPCGFNSGNGEAEDYTFEVTTPPSCPAPTAGTAANITTSGAQLSWTSSGNLFDIQYGISGFTLGTGTIGAATVNQFALSGPLSANTAYQFYVRRICGPGDSSTWAGPFSFRTACGTQTVPYLIDFNDVTIPALPTCTSAQNAGTGNNWKTDNVNGWGFASKLLNYSYNASNPANAWFYTNGIQLEAGTNYVLKFQYGNSGETRYVESMKVNIGSTADYTVMTRNLVDYPAIVNNTPLESSTTFTVETSGVYYLGFNAYSITDRAQIYVDNILVDVSLSNPEFGAAAFKAYPNPVKNILNLSYTNNITNVAVFNLVGQQVIAKPINADNGQIDMSGLPSGTYLVKVTADQAVKTIKIVKE